MKILILKLPKAHIFQTTPTRLAEFTVKIRIFQDAAPLLASNETVTLAIASGILMPTKILKWSNFIDFQKQNGNHSTLFQPTIFYSFKIVLSDYRIDRIDQLNLYHGIWLFLKGILIANLHQLLIYGLETPRPLKSIIETLICN